MGNIITPWLCDRLGLCIAGCTPLCVLGICALVGLKACGLQSVTVPACVFLGAVVLLYQAFACSPGNMRLHFLKWSTRTNCMSQQGPPGQAHAARAAQATRRAGCTRSAAWRAWRTCTWTAWTASRRAAPAAPRRWGSCSTTARPTSRGPGSGSTAVLWWTRV